MTWDAWINAKVAEAEAKEEAAIAILDKIEARRLRRMSEERVKTEVLDKDGGKHT